MKKATVLHPTSALLLALFLFTGCRASQPAILAPSSSDSSDTETAEFKPYSDVIESGFKTDDGLFTLHRDGEKLFYEIPDSLLDVEMLLVSRIARTADNIGYGGEKAGTQVVRWQRQGDQVLLRIVSYENVADEDEPIYEAVRNANFEPIIRAFDIESLAKDSAGVVIEVTDLFAEDVPVLGLQKSRREQYKVRSLDEDRSFIASAKSYPQNIEVRSVLTYEAQEPPSNAQTNAISLEMNHSMVLLPAEPMQPRLYDERVGYFSVEQTDYGLDEQKAAQRQYITRWRLEPSDTAAFRRGELVEPKKPIVYYIDPATPQKWRPYIKQGVADWNKAFEAAGFKNAILAKDPPTAEEDSTFSPEDVRYSVIRYFPSETENAYGPHVHDPRTGEILESDIGWFHNVMNLLAQLVLRPDGGGQPPGAGREVRGRGDGRTRPVRLGARGGSHARAAAQLGLLVRLSRSIASARRRSRASTARPRRSWTTPGSTTSRSPRTASRSSCRRSASTTSTPSSGATSPSPMPIRRRPSARRSTRGSASTKTTRRISMAVRPADASTRVPKTRTWATTRRWQACTASKTSSASSRT